MPDSTKYTSKLHSTRILILGGTSGIGYAVAEACLEHGASAIILSSSTSSRVTAAIQRLQSAYPSKASHVSGYTCQLGDDATLESEIVQLLEKATDSGRQKLDHVIHTAGDRLAVQKIGDATLEGMKKAGNVRFFAPMLLAKHIPKYTHNSAKSSFTITTGAVSQRPRPDWSIINGYATGLQGLCRGLALDLAPVRVNLVSPGFIESELWDWMEEGAREGMRKSVVEGLPTGRLPLPEDVAEQYLAAMKDQNCTGTMFCSNGGSLLK